MGWRVEQVIAVAGALAVFFGTLFQIGYFSKFGLEFLSTASFGDWFYYVGVAGIFFLPVYYVIGERVSLLRARKERVGRKRAELEKNILFLVSFLLGAGTFIYAAFAEEWRFFEAFFWLYFSVRAVLAISDLLRDHEAGSEMKLRTLTPALAMLAISAFATGRLYAETSAGTECLFSFRDGRTLTATYMRSVSDGHLVKLGDNRYYYPKGEVTEIKCDWKKLRE